MKGYIYKYTFPDGKVYIGQTRRDLIERHKEHISPISGPANSAFWEAYTKFGTCELETIYTLVADTMEELVARLNAFETREIIENKSYDPQYGYNKRIFGTSHLNYVHREDRFFRQKVNEIYETLVEEQLDVYNRIREKIYDTMEPFTPEEREFVVKRCIENTFWPLPKSFNIDNLKKNKPWADSEDAFNIQESLSCAKRSVEMDIEDFINNHLDEIYEKVLEDNAILAIDDNGMVALTFYSFDEIAEHFQVKRADNVKNVLAGRQKKAYGYFWKYRKDLEE